MTLVKRSFFGGMTVFPELLCCQKRAQSSRNDPNWMMRQMDPYNEKAGKAKRLRNSGETPTENSSMLQYDGASDYLKKKEGGEVLEAKDYDGKAPLPQEEHDWQLDNTLGVAKHLGTRKRMHHFLNQPAPPPPVLAIYYDGYCKLCMKEINLLKSWDQGRDRIVFTDANQMSNRAIKEELGITGGLEALLASMHSKNLQTGEVYTGMDTFRALYNAIGERNVKYVLPNGAQRDAAGRAHGVESPQAQVSQTTRAVVESLRIPDPPLKATAARAFFKLTKLPVVRPVADLSYSWWAKNREKLSPKTKC